MKNGKQILVFLFCISPLVGTGQTLEEYFREAAENNPGLSAGYLEFEAALEQVEEAKSLPNTNISFGYFISPVETRVGPQQARFSLSQMFPWFGSLDAQGNAAALSAESAYQDFLQERNFLYYKVASAYYPIYELEKLLGIEQANLEILESYKSMANRQFANGRGAMVDVLRVDLQINDARTEIKLLEEKRRPLQTAFNRLLNRPDSMPVEVRDTLIAQAVVNNRDSILFGTHPQLEALRLKSRAAEARGLAIIWLTTGRMLSCRWSA
ncbi:MAG: TolC family protein [Cyclobacteriaceae bacterium]